MGADIYLHKVLYTYFSKLQTDLPFFWCALVLQIYISCWDFLFYLSVYFWNENQSMIYTAIRYICRIWGTKYKINRIQNSLDRFKSWKLKKNKLSRDKCKVLLLGSCRGMGEGMLGLAWQQGTREDLQSALRHDLSKSWQWDVAAERAKVILGGINKSKRPKIERYEFQSIQHLSDLLWRSAMPSSEHEERCREWTEFREGQSRWSRTWKIYPEQKDQRSCV